MVEKTGMGEVVPDRHDLKNAVLFDPNGNQISDVKNGTGKQVLCLGNAKRFWELDLVDGKYAHMKMWHPNGRLSHESSYQNGKQDGLSIGYFANGQLRYRGDYKNGKQVGTWVRFKDDGTLESEKSMDESVGNETSDLR